MNAAAAATVGERVVHKTFPPITRHTLALYCGASGDHNPIHVDLDFARAAGFPDVFSHGMLVMAYLGQALTDAVSPSSIRSFSTRFSAITQLGARLTCEGQIRFGTAGQATAAAVWLVAPCAELFNDSRADDSVDLAVGTDFTTLAHNDDIDAVLASLRPGSTGPSDPILVTKIHASSC